jgi:small subunit ribosomal protein S13
MSKIIYQKSSNFYKKLYKIYGVGKSCLNRIYSKIGINLKTRPRIIKSNAEHEFNKILKKKTVGKYLKEKTKKSINFFYNIRSCKGIRHKKRYPIRGQRTHTNAKTKKRLKT